MSGFLKTLNENISKTRSCVIFRKILFFREKVTGAEITQGCSPSDSETSFVN